MPDEYKLDATFMSLEDVVFPGGQVHPVLRIRRGGKIRVFILTEIRSDGTLIESMHAPNTLEHLF
jgi:hypothetical protein